MKLSAARTPLSHYSCWNWGDRVGDGNGPEPVNEVLTKAVRIMRPVCQTAIVFISFNREQRNGQEGGHIWAGDNIHSCWAMSRAGLLASSRSHGRWQRTRRQFVTSFILP
uniref:Uncharacterized protein n=1 Tax=Saccharum officinarum TaxID=4547 RepID=A0A678THR0_SACOF|nr:hypothetical protein SO13M23_000002 [Saccharum officinarum]